MKCSLDCKYCRRQHDAMHTAAIKIQRWLRHNRQMKAIKMLAQTRAKEK